MTHLSELSPKDLRDRLAELHADYQRLITRGDTVARADKRAQIDVVQRQLSGISRGAQPEAPKAPVEVKEKPVPMSPKMSELRAIVEEGKKRGIVIEPGTALRVDKTGADALEKTAGKMQSKWIEVTPEKAAAWLHNNFRNRPMSDDVVAAYARDMKDGRWVPTHQGIAFNDRDELIDGQHRLQAIIRSGVTVRMMVTFGLASTISGSEMTTMDAVDRGRPRSVADQLRIQHGMKNGAAIAAICATIGGVCYGERTRRLSVGQTLEIYRAFEEPINWMIAHRSKERGFKSTGVMAGFAFALAASHEEAPTIRDHWKALCDGAGQPDSAIGQLRALLSSDAAVLLTRGTDRAMVEVVLEALRLAASAESGPLSQTHAGADHFRALQPSRVAAIARLFTLP